MPIFCWPIGWDCNSSGIKLAGKLESPHGCQVCSSEWRGMNMLFLAPDPEIDRVPPPVKRSFYELEVEVWSIQSCLWARKRECILCGRIFSERVPYKYQPAGSPLPICLVPAMSVTDMASNWQSKEPGYSLHLIIFLALSRWVELGAGKGK